jgi:hypothetical protein
LLKSKTILGKVKKLKKIFKKSFLAFGAGFFFFARGAREFGPHPPRADFHLYGGAHTAGRIRRTACDTMQCCAPHASHYTAHRMRHDAMLHAARRMRHDACGAPHATRCNAARSMRHDAMRRAACDTMLRAACDTMQRTIRRAACDTMQRRRGRGHRAKQEKPKPSENISVVSLETLGPCNYFPKN